MTEDDKQVVGSLQQQDVVRIAEAVFRMLPASPPVPPPAAPAGVITGADARALQHPDTDISAIERIVGMIVAAKLANLMTKEQIVELLDGRTARFQTPEQIDARALSVIRNELDDIGLPIENAEDKRKTGASVRGTLEWHGRIRMVWNTIATGLLATAVYAIAKLIGIKLPNPPGMGG